MNKQPNFNIAADTAAVAGTDYDNMSDSDLRALINGAHKLKTGRTGNVQAPVAPPIKRHIDIDALIKAAGGE
jgi:hypothetical protein